MDILSDLAHGFSVALTLENLLFCLIGTLLGTVLGMLPGIGSASGVAVLLPLTLGMEPVTALIMLAGLYYGCEYGGTISSVLIATPGEGASLVTVIDGHQMARRGQAGQALAIAAIGSFVAGTGGVVLLSIAAPAFASVALEFGPPETFALMVLGLLAVAGIVGTDRLKGLTMLLVGAVIAMAGVDTPTGMQRFTFGRIELFSGVSLVAVVVGMIAITEVLHRAGTSDAAPIRTRFRDMWIRWPQIRHSAGAITRGGLLGFVMGVIPGVGPTLSTFFAYDLERRVAKDASQFGHGDIRGVAAPESANNAAVNGAFVPTLTLGIPGSATTAILLGAFIMFDVRPGPLLFEQQSSLAWGLIASFYLGNLMLLVQNLPLAPVFAAALRIRYAYIYPFLMVVATVSVYAAFRQLFDVWLALGAAVFGYFMKRYGYPVAPVILGLVLGGLLEEEYRRTLDMGFGSPRIFLDRPLALALFALAALILVAPTLYRVIRGRRQRATTAANPEVTPAEPR